MSAVFESFPEWFAPLLFGFVLITSACSFRNSSTDATSAGVSERDAEQPGGMRSSSEWPGYNGGYNAARFSPVTQINTGNVTSLTEVARFKLPETTAFESGPGLIEGTTYVTTATNTYAIDARTAQQRWSHHFDAKSMGLGTPVRGVGYADGRLFRGTPDGYLIALDAKTGKVIWDVVGADATHGE